MRIRAVRMGFDVLYRGDLGGVPVPTMTFYHLQEEQALEREADRAYWAPLRAELEALRREGGRKTR